MPGGLGLVSLNGCFAELGSGLYNLYCLWDNQFFSILYFVGMFISNGTVVALGVLLFFVDGLGVEWQVGYATIVVLLFILRTEGLRREVCAFLSDEQEAGSGTEAELGASAEGSISAL